MSITMKNDMENAVKFAVIPVVQTYTFYSISFRPDQFIF